MAGRAGIFAGIELSVPEAGLRHVLSGWSGVGQLWEALAAVEDEAAPERRWQRRDIARRAHRVMFERIRPHLGRLPRVVSEWILALPAQLQETRHVATHPWSGTRWVETRIRFGWPPTSYSGRLRYREPDMVLARTLKWVAEWVRLVTEDAEALAPGISGAVRRELDALRQASEMEPVASATSERPTTADLRALSFEGHPWTAVGSIAAFLIALESSPAAVALELIRPDPELRYRLFHLGVLGEMLLAGLAVGQVVSLRPLTAGAPGPAYGIRDGLGRTWELWFETGGMWRYYGMRSPYVVAASGLGVSMSPLSADLMLVRRGVRALLIECKYSADATWIARRGVPQALVYAAEAATEVCQSVVAFVTAPAEVVLRRTSSRTSTGSLGVTPATAIFEETRSFLSDPR